MVLTEEHKLKMKEGREKAKKAKLEAKQVQGITDIDTRDPANNKVMIEKSFLEDIRKRMTVLEDDNAMLKQVADKAKMSDFYVRNKGKLPDQYRLRMIDDKIILGWKMIKDDVFIEGPKVIENQVLMLILEDGTQKEMSYRDWIRLYVTVQCSKIGDRIDEQGNLIVKLERNDNKKVYEVGIQFVN